MGTSPDTRLFISYRRGDSADVAGRVHDHLVMAFGRASVFKDTDSIPLGADFRKVLAESVAACDVVLVVIGPGWLSAVDEVRNRRLDDPYDYVRIEIETALTREIPVIPLLLGDTPVVRAEQLPESLRVLAYLNGARVRPDPDFHGDIERVVKAIKAGIRQSPSSAAPSARRSTPRRPLASLVAMALVLSLALIGYIVYPRVRDAFGPRGPDPAGQPGTDKSTAKAGPPPDGSGGAAVESRPSKAGAQIYHWDSLTVFDSLYGGTVFDRSIYEYSGNGVWQKKVCVIRGTEGEVGEVVGTKSGDSEVFNEVSRGPGEAELQSTIPGRAPLKLTDSGTYTFDPNEKRWLQTGGPGKWVSGRP